MYHGHDGREYEDAEMDNMRANHREREAEKQKELQLDLLFGTSAGIFDKCADAFLEMSQKHRLLCNVDYDRHIMSIRKYGAINRGSKTFRAISHFVGGIALTFVGSDSTLNIATSLPPENWEE